MGNTNPRSWHEQDEFWDAFAATIFDAQRRSVAGKEVDDIVRLTGLQPTQTVCDLCCGIGRHSLEDEKAERMVLVGRKSISGGLDGTGPGGV